jgi:hypothetical protein
LSQLRWPDGDDKDRRYNHYRLCIAETAKFMATADARQLDDCVLEEYSAHAIRAGDQAAAAVLRAEATERFRGMFGLPPG